MESFVTTPISITVIADSIQQQFATSHTKITRYLHHKQAVPNVIQIRRKGIHCNKLTTKWVFMDPCIVI